MKPFTISNHLISLFFVVVGLVLLISHLKSYDFSQTEMGTDRLEEIIRQYATTCYALEGSYPSSLDYLQENYGLILDQGRYIYHYDAFASNILPDIKVIPRGEKEADHE